MEKLKQIPNEEFEALNDFNKFILEDFITNSTELSPKSKKSYESNLKIWFKWVKDNLNNKSQVEIKPLEFKKFQNWLVNRKCSSADINNKRAAISSLNNYIEIYYNEEYPTFRNFINKSIKRPSNNVVHEKEPLTKAEFDNLISVLEENGELQKIAYLEFCLASGCRRAESRQLLKTVINAKPIIKVKQVENEDKTVADREVKYYQTHPIRCKGKSEVGKVRKLYFNEKAMQSIKRWIAYRDENWKDDCPFVFVTRYNGQIKQIGETTLNAWCSNDFEKIVGRRVHPHLIRATTATQLVVEDGKDIESVKTLLGHESSSTTQHYVVRNEDENIDDLF